MMTAASAVLKPAGILVTVLLSLSSGQATPQTAQTAPAEPWPPAGVYLPGAGVTPPRALTRVEPTYSREAMRQKIQGVVTLACVVQADGTVGAVRVRQSPGFGLDEQAISALKQWKFAPGTKAGVAVPVAVTVNLAFSIRGEAPPSTFPESFVMPTTPDPSWTQDAVEAEGLEIRFAYPAGWAVRKDSSTSSNRLATLYQETGTRSLIIGRPRRLPGELPQPFSLTALQQFADRMQSAPSLGPGKLERLAFGQALITDRWWIWLDLQAATLPPEIALATNDAFDGVRIWAFITLTGARELTLYCNSLLLRAASSSEAAEMTRLSRAELSAILARISIRTHLP